MSRFVHLEFDGRSREPSGHGPGLEARCLAEAAQAFESGDFEASLRLHARALEFNAANPAGWLGQIRSLIELGRWDESGHWADQALERFPKNAGLLAAKAVALARQGDFEAAIAFSDAAFAEQAEGPHLWLSRADVFLSRRGDASLADVCFDRAFVGDRRDWVVAWLAARIRLFHEQFAHALKHARQAVDWNPASASAWATVGVCQDRLGLSHLAEVSLARALELDPRCEPALRLHRELRHAGPWRRIGGWFRRLLPR